MERPGERDILARLVRFGFDAKVIGFCGHPTLSAVHDFSIGPRANAAWERDPRSASSARLRRQAVRIARLNLLLALVVTVLAIMLVRGAPW